jgi:hypothetical protein
LQFAAAINDADCRGLTSKAQRESSRSLNSLQLASAINGAEVSHEREREREREQSKNMGFDN